MSTTVTYKGQTLTTVENQTKTLNTAGTWVEGDFTLTDVTQGGGGGLFEKLYETTLTENVRTVSLDASAWVDWKIIMVFLNGSLDTASTDWIYWNINSTAIVDPRYCHRDKDMDLTYIIGKPKYGPECTVLYQWRDKFQAEGPSDTSIAWADLQTFNMMGYGADITAGTTIEVWGTKYESL